MDWPRRTVRVVRLQATMGNYRVHRRSPRAAGGDLGRSRRELALGKTLKRGARRFGAVVARLPKTRSGKILRSTMRRIADGEDRSVSATIEDPAALTEIRESLAGIGYAQSA